MTRGETPIKREARVENLIGYLKEVLEILEVHHSTDKFMTYETLVMQRVNGVFLGAAGIVRDHKHGYEKAAPLTSVLWELERAYMKKDPLAVRDAIEYAIRVAESFDFHAVGF